MVRHGILAPIFVGSSPTTVAIDAERKIIMLEMKTPCMNCSTRSLGCHGKCKDYAEYKQRLDELKKAKDKANVVDKYVSYNINSSKRRVKYFRNYGLND